MTGLERNVLERKLKLARKAVRETELTYKVLDQQSKTALEIFIAAGMTLHKLEAEKRAAVQLDDDLAGKNGPILSLSRGQCVLTYTCSSEQYPDTFKNIRIHMRPLGDPNRSLNIDLRENGRFGDTFTEEDVDCVLAALPNIEDGQKVLDFYRTWSKA